MEAAQLAELKNAIIQLFPTVNLSDAKVLKENYRADVLRFTTGDGSNLIAKKFKALDAQYYAERVGLEFLNTFNNPAYPRYLGSDDSAGILVMSDLGKGQTLEPLLSGENSAAATDALLQQVRLVARLHAETAGQQDRYKQLFMRLNRPLTDLPLAQSEELRSWLPHIEKTLAALNVSLPEHAQPELDQIARIIARPTAFATFTHGDVAPSQVLYTASGAHLLDFEYSGYRHALYDVAGWQIVCPYPADLVAKLNEIYRHEVSGALPGAGNDGLFYRDLAALCFFDLARYLRGLLPAVLPEDKPWAPGVSGRRGIMFKLGAFTNCAQNWQVFPVLRQIIAALRQKLLQAWGEDTATIGDWRAFGGELTFPSPS